MTATDCLFCKIVAEDIAADMVYDSDTAVAFRDLNPQAPTHVLIVPRQHIAKINDIDDDHQALVGSLVTAAKSIAANEGLSDDGYRVVMNCNEAA